MATPRGLLDAPSANYDGVATLAASRSRAVLHAARSGILRGDPASGAIFVAAAHPVGRDLEIHLHLKRRGIRG
eukprot:116766-Pyramimonas_sp.AAC.1